MTYPIPQSAGVRKVRAMKKARAAGNASVTNGHGASVLADRMQHGGYRGAVGGGNANARPSTKRENAKWLKGRKKLRDQATAIRALSTGPQSQAAKLDRASGAAARRRSAATVMTRRARRS